MYYKIDTLCRIGRYSDVIVIVGSVTGPRRVEKPLPGQTIVSYARPYAAAANPTRISQVRTKDRQFDSVCHLISFHRNNNLPIVSAGSMLMLQQPVIRKIER